MLAQCRHNNAAIRLELHITWPLTS